MSIKNTCREKNKISSLNKCTDHFTEIKMGFAKFTVSTITVKLITFFPETSA